MTITPADGASDVRLDVPVQVSAANGILRDVRVTSEQGSLDGAFNPDRTAWTASVAVQPGTRYQVSATAAGADDLVTPSVTAFTTMTPQQVLTTDVQPYGGAVVGIGTPIVVNFSRPVINRAAVQKRLELTMSKPVEGAWNWFSSTQVRYRPRLPWPSGEKVTLRLNLAGLDAGDGVWGTSSRSVGFTVGDAHVSTVDLVAHSMTVTSNGKVVRTFPISGGRPDRPTMGGPHNVLFKAPSMIFDTTRTATDPADQLPAHLRLGRQLHQRRRVRAFGALVRRVAGVRERLARLRERLAGKRRVVLLLQPGRRHHQRDQLHPATGAGPGRHRLGVVMGPMAGG